MKTRFIFSMLTAMLFSMISGPLLAIPFDVNPFAVSGALFAVSFIPKPAGIMAMALDVEIWKPWIVEQLFAGNDFLNAARNADEHVLQGKVVHIPNAGNASGVMRNRTTLPASITKRTDIDVTYALDEFTSNPRLIESADKILSYDKMSSVMGQDMRAIKDLVAKWIIYKWATYSASTGDTADIHKIATTGAAATGNNYLTGATGTRKKAVLANLEEAQAYFDDNDVPEDGRFCLIDNRMLAQMTAELSAGDYKDFSRVYDPVKGVVGELFGFKFYKRSSVLRFTTAGAAKAPDVATATTDNAAALLWQSDWVERAIGTTEVFEDMQNPQFYGDIYSLLLRVGGRRVAADGTGIQAIVQAAG